MSSLPTGLTSKPTLQARATASTFGPDSRRYLGERCAYRHGLCPLRQGRSTAAFEHWPLAHVACWSDNEAQRSVASGSPRTGLGCKPASIAIPRLGTRVPSKRPKPHVRWLRPRWTVPPVRQNTTYGVSTRTKTTTHETAVLPINWKTETHYSVDIHGGRPIAGHGTSATREPPR